MKNTDNKSNFEKEWQNAFEGAEMTPSDELWTRLDAHLANDKADNYKRGIFYYKLIAAASVAMAIIIGLSAYLKDDAGNIAETKPDTKENTKVADHYNQNQNQETFSDDIEEKESKESQDFLAEDIQQPAFDDHSNDVPVTVTNSNPTMTLSENSRSIAQLDKLQWQDLKVYYHNYTIVNKKEVPVFELIEEKEDDSPLWAGVKFSSGIFDPNFKSGSGANILGLNPSAEYLNTLPVKAGFADSREQIQESSDPGLTFSFGFNFGLKLSDKFILQSGFAYTENTSSSNTSAVIDEQNSSKTYPLHISNYNRQEFNLRNVRIISDRIPLNNTFEFVSIPLKAGYILLDKRIGIILSAGVATDIFLKNSIVDEQNRFADVTVTPGSGSPYKNLSWNGLAGTQLLYNFSENYSLALEPSYMISLNGLTKGDYYYQSRPKSFSVGIGMRYHFK